jgi:gamma-glutamyltranspeptidase/glutathione hydrolase
VVTGVAAGHPATARVGLSVLAAGGSAADAAVAAVLASCVAESVFTGITGGGFATYFDAASGEVTVLDFCCAIPGLDADVTGTSMMPIDVMFGTVPVEYSIGGASVAVPGVPAGCGEVHRRWGRLPWHEVVAPAVDLARDGVALPEQQARTLANLAQALAYGAGSAIYVRDGRLLNGGDLLFHPGLDETLTILADEGPSTFYTGRVADLMVRAARADGGSLGPRDLAEYRVLPSPVGPAGLHGHRVFARRDDLGDIVATIDRLPDDLAALGPADRAVTLARALATNGPQTIGNTTNVTVVDAEANACVVTTTLGIGSGVWLPGLGVHLNSMLGEGELITPGLAPGEHMVSNMCPLVVLDADDRLTLAAGSAGASRIRSALVQTLVHVLLDGDDPDTAVGRPRLHPVASTVHVEPGHSGEQLSALAAAGFDVTEWSDRDHYFGGVTAVGEAGAAGDPRRGGAGLVL